MSGAARAVISDLASGWPSGTQKGGLLCPFCNGGTTRERSLSVQRARFAIQYKCHRDSCKKGGTIPMGPATKEETPKRDYGVWDRAFNGLVKLPKEVEKLLFDNFGLDSLDCASAGFEWSPDTQRLFMPIRNAHRFHIGGVFRALAKDMIPKAVTLVRDNSIPLMAWYPNLAKGFDNIIVVEDQLSAAGCRTGTASAVALLGTHADVNKMRHIAREHPKKVVICLDADAVTTGMDIAAKWGTMFENCRVVKPPKDLKNMTIEERRKFVQGAFE